MYFFLLTESAKYTDNRLPRIILTSLKATGIFVILRSQDGFESASSK